MSDRDLHLRVVQALVLMLINESHIFHYLESLSTLAIIMLLGYSSGIAKA
jgi:hypothetical protein